MLHNVLREHWIKVFLTCVLGVASGLANIFLLRIINEHASNYPNILQSSAMYGGVLLLMIGLGFLSQFFLLQLSGNAFHKIRSDLTSQISELTYQQFEETGSHRLYTALTTDIGVLSSLITLIPNYVFNITVMICCLIYMAAISHQLFLITLIFLALAVLVTRYLVISKGRERYREARNLQDGLFSCYESVVKGFKELKSNESRRKDIHHGLLNVLSEEYRQKTLYANTYWMVATNINSGVIFLSIGVIVIVSTSVLRQPAELLMQYIVVMIYMINPSSVLSNMFRDISKVAVISAKLGELRLAGNTTPKKNNREESKSQNFGPFRNLTLKNIEFSYSDRFGTSFTVGPFDLDIRKGEIVFLVGGNGSGKTTIAKLISGLYRADGGAIKINGIDITEDNEESYQNYFSTIFSDYYLFDQIISKNKLMVDDKKISEFLALLKLPSNIYVEDGKLSSVDLSQGQRKRLALLVSYFEHSEVYIFDEWAADQDPEFREYFYCHLLGLLANEGKTLVVITHDDRYFNKADKVVQIEYGKVVCIDYISEFKNAADSS